MALHVDLDPVAPESDIARRIIPVVERDLEAHRLAVPPDRERHVAHLDYRVDRKQSRHVWIVSRDGSVTAYLRGLPPPASARLIYLLRATFQAATGKRTTRLELATLSLGS